MATLLGTATLTGQFTTDFNDARVITHDLNRVTSTPYRNPITIHTQGLNVIETRDFRPIIDSDFNPYIVGGYLDENYFEDTSIWTTGFSSTDALNCVYDFLEVDPTATINSIQIQMTLASTGTINSNGNYGRLKARWATKDGGFTDSSVITIDSQSQQTITFTITPDSSWLTYNPTGLGREQWARIQAEDTFTSLTIYAIRARVNYTGRTRFTTGFKSYSTKSVLDFIPGTDTNPPPIPTEFTRLYKTEGYGFSIPSNHDVDGALLKYGFGSVVNGTYPTGDSLHFKTTVGGTHTRVSTNGLYTLFDFPNGGYLSGGQGGVYAREINAIDEDNTRAEITTAEANDSTFGMEARFAYEFASTRPAEPVVFDINLAYVGPISSGDININTVSTLTATPVMTHGNTADEIDDFVTTTSLTALGGFLLEGTANPSTVTTTTLGTAGLTRTGFTVSMSAQFTVPAVDVEFAITAVAFSFPSAGMTVSGAVERTSPAAIQGVFTLAQTGLVGRTRTGHTTQFPAVATIPNITDVLLVKAPALSQILTQPTQTRTYTIPGDLRTYSLETQTRTHQINTEVRTITVEQQTRTTVAEGL